MSTIADIALFRMVRDFLMVYIPKQRRLSDNTAKAYRTALDLLLRFVKDSAGIALCDVTFEMLDRGTVLAFLDHLEEARGCSVATRNNRLACIRSFFAYAASLDPAVVALAADLRKIPLKKHDADTGVDYMTETAVSALLAAPDTSTKKGLRDQFVMVMLYDTGARIDELLSVTLGDINLGVTPTIRLFGKGRKVRTVPITPRTAEHCQRYLDAFHSDSRKSGDYLIYIERRDGRKKMSDDNVRKMLSVYGRAARAQCPEVPSNVHPHLWRHSRAMHLYQHGMDLMLVSQWLGHASPQTTLIYARADTEQKRLAIEAAMGEQGLLDDDGCDRYKESDEDILRRLYGLR